MKSLSFFRADIFSQNEVETIAAHRRFQLQLLDSFIQEELQGLEGEFSQTVHQITLLAKQIAPLEEKLSLAEETARQLDSITGQLAKFASQGDPTGAAIDQAHKTKALRGRETRAFEATDEALRELDGELEAMTGKLRTELRGKIPQEADGGPNAEIFTTLRDDLRACSDGVDKGIAVSRAAIQTCLQAIAKLQVKLESAHTRQEMDFRELVEKHQQHQAQSTERAGLERKRNEALDARETAERLRVQIREQQAAHQRQVVHLSELRDRRFQLRKKTAKRLNASLSPTINIAITMAGDTSAYQALVEETLKGQGVKQGIVAQKLVKRIAPATLAEYVRIRDVTAIASGADLNNDQAAKLVDVFRSPEKLALLETVELQDEPSIRLLVGDTYKDADTLSTGQKCTTILPILMLEGTAPVLIDQPEDNLDNRFIFNTVVGNIQKATAYRQLILVTHNPNIPVLGEAEKVLVMESDGEHARLVAQGSVDECKDHIVTLLEGGEEAFIARGKRYHV